MFSFTKKNPLPEDARLYLIIGQKEGTAVKDTEKMFAHILTAGHPKENLSMKVDSDGDHNESSWRKQFIPAIKWLYEQ